MFHPSPNNECRIDPSIINRIFNGLFPKYTYRSQKEESIFARSQADVSPCPEIQVYTKSRVFWHHMPVQGMAALLWDSCSRAHSLGSYRGERVRSEVRIFSRVTVSILHRCQGCDRQIRLSQMEGDWGRGKLRVATECRWDSRQILSSGTRMDS